MLNVSLTMLSTVLGLAHAGGWRQTRSSTNGFLLPPFLAAKWCTACRIRFDRYPAAAPTSDLYRQGKASAPPRGGLATRGSSRAGSNGYLRPPDERTVVPTCSPSSAAPIANVEPSRGISIIAVPRPDSGLIFEHASTCWDTVPISRRASAWTLFRFRPEICSDKRGGGLQLAAESLRVAGALESVSFGVALMRAAFQFALSFAKSEKRGGIQQIIQHQVVGYALADAKTTIEAARVLSWHACRALDTAAPGAHRASLSTPRCSDRKQRCGSYTNLMQVVGVDSYGHELPLAGLLQDAMALPLFAGGNIGVRRRQFARAYASIPAYDDLATLDGICLAETVPLT